TPIRLHGREWSIEITLTNREDMLFRMLLGRSAIVAGGMIVDPSASYLAGAHRKGYRRHRSMS
ncbi:MAG TPA: RimK/LysX family protein, partial [Gammaproteobacteria bacterium]|nr:RimK/LysX family protein [Gammaproteobacteria bacterium]